MKPPPDASRQEARNQGKEQVQMATRNSLNAVSCPLHLEAASRLTLAVFVDSLGRFKTGFFEHKGDER